MLVLLSCGIDVLSRIINFLDCIDAAHLLLSHKEGLFMSPIPHKQLHSGWTTWRYETGQSGGSGSSTSSSSSSSSSSTSGPVITDCRPYLPLMTSTQVRALCSHGSVSSVVVNLKELKHCSQLLGALTSSSSSSLSKLILRVENTEDEMRNISNCKSALSMMFSNGDLCSNLLEVGIDLGDIVLPDGILPEINKNCSRLKCISRIRNFSDRDVYYFLEPASSAWVSLEKLQVGNILSRCLWLRDQESGDTISTEDAYDLVVTSMCTSKFPRVRSLDFYVEDYDVLHELFACLLLTRYANRGPGDILAEYIEFDSRVESLAFDVDNMRAQQHWERMEQWQALHRQIEDSQHLLAPERKFSGFYRNATQIKFNNWLPSNYFVYLLTSNMQNDGVLRRNLELKLCCGNEDPSGCKYLENCVAGPINSSVNSNRAANHFLPITTFELSMSRLCLPENGALVPFYLPPMPITNQSGSATSSDADERFVLNAILDHQQYCGELYTIYRDTEGSRYCRHSDINDYMPSSPYGESDTCWRLDGEVHKAFIRAVLAGRLKYVENLRISPEYTERLLRAFRKGVEPRDGDSGILQHLDRIQKIQVDIDSSCLYAFTSRGLKAFVKFHELIRQEADGNSDLIVQFRFQSYFLWSLFIRNGIELVLDEDVPVQRLFPFIPI
jgi:hypothetical protein